ncbi:UNVERIFIED_CONTAM: hypothetical protein PYX00_005998 [Menopon gallinae]|uniref:lysoplasmalogenase n=1 Tax=Menopon gallinae TaxID=328185 RepID=A0AAW2HVM3_9NEOP
MLLKLAPFAITTAIYFYFMSTLEPSLFALVVKCLPIFSLAGAVFSSTDKRTGSGIHKLIFYALIASSVGDACLVWDKSFPLGMVAFAIAHCFYIKAFGFKPLKPGIGLALYATAGLILLKILPNIKDPIILNGIPVYCIFLTTMSWRALARATDGPDAWSWSKTLCGVGSLLFIFSDTMICFHDLQNPVPYGRFLIMSTYYAAQLGLALSIQSSSNSGYRSAKKKK